MPKHYSNGEGKMKGSGNYANMPQEVKHTSYPSAYSNLDTDYHDTIEGVDKDLKDSFKKAAHYPSDSMY
ncbi:hypothetical protein LCGC14_0456820 [marine sediment metagenome]|uniref:Uncharacterized protein n=1 Tax=marine sediment metagenome TaxID=412755 RepID=A0A0F9SGA1_9ZZZZ|nr:hypothetical protein [Candidatus Aminicenantes bacterium]